MDRADAQILCLFIQLNDTGAAIALVQGATKHLAEPANRRPRPASFRMLDDFANDANPLRHYSPDRVRKVENRILDEAEAHTPHPAEISADINEERDRMDWDENHAPERHDGGML